MKKIIKLLFLSGFFLIISGMGAITLLKHPRPISDVENRTLAQRPDLSKSALISGEFFSNFEKYFTDQLYGRDSIIKAYTKEQLIQGKTIINNNVVAKDNWLLFSPGDKLTYKDIDSSEKQLQTLTNSLNGSGVEFYFAAAPYKMNMLMYKYPNYLSNHLGVKNQQYFMSHLPKSIHGINMYNYFKKSYTKQELEQMYFRTDHHWDYKGAFAGYQEIIRTMSEQSKLFKDTPKNTNDFKTICNNKGTFIGSINMQMHNLISAKGEPICYYSPAFDPKNATVQAKEESGDIVNNFNQIFGTGFDGNEVMYGQIFTWDLPEINYEYKNANNNLHLLILKDSYGNSAQPYIAQHFRKTSVIDLRHYHEKSVSQYIKDNHIDIVLFIYNDSNLSGEMYDHLTE